MKLSTIKIKLSPNKAKRFAQHLKKEHPNYSKNLKLTK